MNVKDFLIPETMNMLEAMKQLDELAKKVLFVERDGKIIASLTDGDIRRWILQNGDLNVEIHQIANYEPKYITESQVSLAHQKMKEWSIEAIPVLDENGALVRVVFWHDEVKEAKHLNVPVVMMAGGFGTRLYPYTKILPKPLIPIGDLPIAEHIMNRFHEVGVQQFHLIVNNKKNMIKAYFNELERNYKVDYADEDEPLGTGGGLSLLKGMIDDTFFFTNCDILVEEAYDKIYHHHQEAGNMITMVCSLKNVKIPYGVVEMSDDGQIASMKEKPDFNFFTNTGLYVVEPRVIDELEADVNIGFPEIIEQYRQQGERIGVYPVSDDAWLDMGQFDEMEKMRERLEHHDA
ncbi:sugar phosphate nucleotidyltransferase [Alkalibacillus sp. S2W]|uniref:sugar phosphate nucleotidyltransferase n=1 Tax=Alkalibacillus sp. S2W TaxID=3386553 RepID=UPI00398D63A3